MNDAHIRNGKTTSSSNSVHSTSTSHSIKPASFTNSANISSASSFASPQMGAPALSPPSSGPTNSSSPSVHDNSTNTDASVTVTENTSSTSGLGLGLGLTSDTMTASSISSQNVSIAANNRSSNASPSCNGPTTGSPSSQSDLFAGSVPAFDNTHGHDGRSVRMPPYGATNPIGSTPTTVSRPSRSALSEIIADSVRIPSSSTNNTTNAAVAKPIGLGLSGTGLGPGFDPAPQRPVTVVVRRLPVGTDSDSAKLMMLFLGENLVDIETAPDAEEPEFVSATVTVRSRAAADQVLRNLNNKMNSRATAHMVVEIASGSSSPTQGSGQMRGISPTGSRSLLQSSVPYSAAPSSSIQQQQQHSVGGSNSSSTIGVNANQDMTAADNLSDSIMTYLWFNNVDPVGPGHIGPVQRRATLAHISPQQTANLSSAMGNLSLNTNFTTGHLGNYGGPASAISPMLGRNQASPMTAGGISAHPMNFGNQTPQGPQYRRNSNYPSANPADQNPPCNTLYVGNLPQGTTEEELKSAFSGCKGYKRLCYRVKSNGPMCFVEFEDVPAATKCLKDMYGFLLPRSNKHGIRLSFSKNPLGVRSSNTTASPNSLSGALGQHQSPFTSVTGPPPGLAAPPGLNLNVNAAAAAAAASRNGSTANGMYPVGGETTPASATLPQSATGFYLGSATANPWNPNMFSPQAPIGAGSPASSINSGFGNGFFMHMSPGQQQSQQQQGGKGMFPPHMMGR